ncbi:reverse transcriptase domain-containing protein [Tanacetum coccineum]
MTPPSSFSTLTPIPDSNVNELPPITTSAFIIRSLENTPLAFHPSTLANSGPMISPAIVEANYEVLKPLLKKRKRQMRNEDLLSLIETVVEFEDAPNRDGGREERNSEAHLRRGENGQPLQSSLTFVHGGHRPLVNTRGNLPPNEVGNVVACHMFTYTLKDYARIWWNSQKAGSILNYEDLKAKFRSHFSQQKKFTKTHLTMHNIKQREGESTRAFVTRYTDDTLRILGLHEEQHIFGFVHGLKTISFVEFLSKDLPTTYKGLMEKTCTWIKAKEVATNGTQNDHQEIFDRFKKKSSSWDNNKGKKNIDRFSPYFHGHDTNQRRELRHQIKEAVNSRQLTHLVKGIKKGKAKALDTQLGEWKKGEKDIVKVKSTILMINREDQTLKRWSMEESVKGIREITIPLFQASTIPLIQLS